MALYKGVSNYTAFAPNLSGHLLYWYMTTRLGAATALITL